MATKGQNVWFDLMTTDTEAAKRFYTETIGWKTEPYPDAEPGKPYTMWKAGSKTVGGFMALPAEAKGVPPHWVAYTVVDDVDATAARAKGLGATVHHGPFDIPKVGRCAFLAA